MRLKRLELLGFKSFAKKTSLLFDTPIAGIVGPNGSGKSNVAEAFRWVLGEQSLKSLRGKRGEDLIFNGAVGGSRLNHAAVSIAFDNSDKKFNVDYDEVVVTREVFRDGVNEYSINGSKVRLRDVLELLSSVSLGSTGHHIINQGEADRILNANSFERKAMIEEALGLNLYHWKITESERKLEKTDDNIKQVESLRREIAPHIKFLKKQVEKIEKADELRRELKALYFEYLKKEDVYLKISQADIARKKDEPARQLAEIEAKLSALMATLAETGGPDRSGEANEVDRRIRQLRSQHDELARKLGRLEGIIEIKAERLAEPEEVADAPISYPVVRDLVSKIEKFVAEAEQSDDLSGIRGILLSIKNTLSVFWQTTHHEDSRRADWEKELAEARSEKNATEEEMARLSETETRARAELENIKKQSEEAKEATRGAEREVFELRSARSEISSRLEAIRAQEERWLIEERSFKTELTEAGVLVDQEVLDFDRLVTIDNYDPLTDREAQENRRKQIERLKIRLEDMGIEGTDVLKEFKEASERDEFLMRELEDLIKSKEDLSIIIKDLKERLEVEFKEGIEKINQAFRGFFASMFDGGDARLDVVKDDRRSRANQTDDLSMVIAQMGEAEEKEIKEGIEVQVNLPRKKIRGLQMLSGGERALTSIALLFAMSQVNPPPFLILDETDAALDEANSRKYGDMIENLSKYSQLILVTHNRETMSRAGILYGVTMGGDGVSKLLSIKFDEAEAWAK